MKGVLLMGTQRKKPTKKRKSVAGRTPAYPFKFRLKVARLYVEDGYPAPLVAQQFGISDYSVYRWGKLYRLQGEAGLMHSRSRKQGSKLPAAVTQNIIDLKKENPGRGARRI
jgi:transposase-like protein